MQIKRSTIYLLAMLFMAIGVSIATAKNTRFTRVFYQTNGMCMEADAIPCDYIGFPDCITLVFPADGSPIFNTQIYRSRINSYTCREAYGKW